MTKLRAVVRRRWSILLLTALLGAVAGFVSVSIGTKRGITYFQAEQVIVANRQPGSLADVSQDALKVTRGAVLDRAAEMLEIDEPPQSIAGRVRTDVDTDSNSITLISVNPDPAYASRVVQAFSAAFLEVVNRDLRAEDTRQLEQLTQRRDETKAELEAFDTQNGFLSRTDVQLPQTETVNALLAERDRLVNANREAQQQLDQFELRTRQTAPYASLGSEKPRVADAQLIEVPESPIFRAGLLGSIGLLLGVGLVLIIERVNQRIDTRSELAELIHVPIIAEIGRIPARHRHDGGSDLVSLDGVWSEHYRRVRSAIQFVQTAASAPTRNGDDLNGHAKVANAAVITGHQTEEGVVPRVFLVVSALPGDGKSTTAALTALALAETGQDTVVVDADFRKPRVEKYLGVGRNPSLADRAVLDVNRPSIDDIVQPANVPHLWVAASGPPTSEVTARLQAAKEVTEEAAARGGTVVIDTSPLRVSNDPIDLLSAVDEVVLVVRAGRTTVKSIEDTMELLAVHHAPVLGVVLIGTLSTREMYSYYQSYYRYSGSKDDGSSGGGTDPGSSPDEARPVAGLDASELATRRATPVARTKADGGPHVTWGA